MDLHLFYFLVQDSGSTNLAFWKQVGAEWLWLCDPSAVHLQGTAPTQGRNDRAVCMSHMHHLGPCRPGLHLPWLAVEPPVDLLGLVRQFATARNRSEYNF